MTAPCYADDAVTLWHGDCLDVLRTLPDASVDSVVTDPPYGLEFMGKEWDSFKTGRGEKYASGGAFTTTEFKNLGALPSYVNRPAKRCAICGKQAWSGSPCKCPEPQWVMDNSPLHSFQAWCTLWARECLRVLKPGGVILAFGGTRTWHRLACAVEDAGFEIRDSIAWISGSGFPKSLNVSKAIESLPACVCPKVGGDVAVEPSGMTGTVRASVGAEAGTVPFAGIAADLTDGVRAQVGTTATNGLRDVNALDIDRDGQRLPVVLRPSAMTRTAESEQIVGGIGCVEVNPEALRDQVMGEKSTGASTVSAPPVTLDGGVGDVGPAIPFVLPLAAAPCGIIDPSESALIADSHAGSGTVDGGVSPSPELVTADGADMDSVAGALHASQSTAERAVRCEVCGGVAGEIPKGLGTALKPAFEPIVVARKPLIGTVAANVLAYGTGALNIDGCRVAHDEPEGHSSVGMHGRRAGIMGETVERFRETTSASTAGRWPANVILDDSQAAELDRQSGFRRPGERPASAGITRPKEGSGASLGAGWSGLERAAREVVDEGGGASRFFKVVSESPSDLVFFPTFRYEAKAPTHERPRVGKVGGGIAANVCAKCGKQDLSGSRCKCPEPEWIPRAGGEVVAHPTVKPLNLLRWLVRLVTPPGGTVLDPFAGSGTTAEACVIEGFRCIAIEREADYLPLIVQRLKKPIAMTLDFGESA